MKFESLRPGMTVYDVGRHKMGNTTMSTVAVWSVRIVSVDPETQSCMASWNTNTPRRFSGRSIGKWRVSKPVMIEMAMGRRRIATRAEQKALKELAGCCPPAMPAANMGPYYTEEIEHEAKS